MNYDQFRNLSCYEEFEIQCDLFSISKIDVLKEIGHRIDDYYFFVSDDGFFNWYDLEGNHIKDPSVLKEIKEEYIPKTITKCIIPNSVISIDKFAFYCNKTLKEITIHNSVTNIGYAAFCWCKSLTTVVIPNNKINIDNYVFAHCKSLTEITIPDNVTNIGYKVFYECISLKEVIFKGKTLDEVKRMKNYPFGIEDKCVIHISH